MMGILKFGPQVLQKNINVFQVGNLSQFLPLLFNSEYVCFNNRNYFVIRT